MRENPAPHYSNAGRTNPTFGARQLAIWILTAVAAIIAFTGAYFWGASNASVTHVEILIPTPAPAVIQIVGEVRSPGVYEMQIGDRVLDAIEAAGGMTEAAAIESVNLAAIVKDGSRIVVPAIHTEPATTTNASILTPLSEGTIQDTAAARLSEASPLAEPRGFPIDLNTATVEQLKSLPDIGDTRANQIVEFRASIGSFSTLEQLLEISGIGTKTLEAIRPLVTVR